MPEKFLVVDDHPLFLDALKLAIQTGFPDPMITEAASVSGALAALEAEGQFDLVLLDLAMPETHGFDGLLELRSLFPKVPIVIVSAMDDRRIIHTAMTCGAAGYISKSINKSELVKAIQTVMDGNVSLPDGYVPPEPSDDEAATSEGELTARLRLLTPQQFRVLKMLRKGLLNKQIAYELNVGETTIKAHVSEILRKLDLTSRTQVVIEVAKIDFDNFSHDWNHEHPDKH